MISKVHSIDHPDGIELLVRLGWFRRKPQRKPNTTEENTINRGQQVGTKPIFVNSLIGTQACLFTYHPWLLPTVLGLCYLQKEAIGQIGLLKVIH